MEGVKEITDLISSLEKAKVSPNQIKSINIKWKKLFENKLKLNYSIMDDNSLMPFGKHKGIPLKDVPDDYLYWLHGNGTSNNELAEYLEENIDSIKQNINKNRYYNKV